MAMRKPAAAAATTTPPSAGAAAAPEGGTTPPAGTVPPKGQEPTGQQPPPAATTNDPPPGDGDLGFTAKQQAYVSGLRKEAAANRTKAKDLESQVGNLNNRFSKLEGGLKSLFSGEDANLTPEQKVEKLTAHNEQLEMQNAISEAAIEHGVVGENAEYFDFLIRKEVSALAEGGELSGEQVATIAAKAKAQGVAAGTAKKTSTSVDGGEGGGETPPPENLGDDKPTVDQFAAMTMAEKSVLYQKNEPLYQQLLAEARTQRKLI